MNLFYERSLRDVLESAIVSLKAEVESLDRNYLLNANEIQLVQHFCSKCRIEPLEIHTDRVSVSDREERIPAERFDSFRFNVEPGESYPKQVITYHVPFSGNESLLRCSPSKRSLTTFEVRVGVGEIHFDFINWSDNVAHIKGEAERVMNHLSTHAGYVANDVMEFNARLEGEVSEIIRSRKAGLLKKSNLLASLGVPVKRSSDPPSTFAVPAPQKKVIIAKPSAPTTTFAPEPTLDESTYNDILNVIHDTGVEIERHPSIYQGKDEETLRDHLLMVLSPNFSSVTGETFNKAGKTDILIRHESKNVFVAECGIWKGAKQFLEKIDQLLSYLTWRDSKTALICFVRNKEFGAVLTTIKTEIKGHKCFVKEHSAAGEASLRYEFTLKDDPTRSVRLAVLCFHYP